MCSVGVRAAVEALLEKYKHEGGSDVLVEFGTAPQLATRIETGAVFDAAILTPIQIEYLVANNKVLQEFCTPIASAGMGLAVRVETEEPKIDTDGELKSYLLGVSSIASGNPANGGFGALYFDRLVERLGVANNTRPKTKFSPPGEFAKPAAAGDVEVGVGLISEIIHVDGVKVVPLMPGDLTSYNKFVGAVAVGSVHVEAAKDFLEMLTSPEGKSVFQANGMSTD
jgi:molybdate transport system substrate-binding protein